MAAPPRPLVRARTAVEWRAWLARNGATKREAWLVLHRKSTGRSFVPYDEAVEEALCVGWIDGKIVPLGNDSRAQRYTPRRPGSHVSELNRERVRKLVRQGRMTAAGLAALPGVEEWLNPPRLVLPPDIAAALRAGKALSAFRRFPEPYRRIRVGWVEGARDHPEEFRRRLAHLVKRTARGEQFGTIP